jgi:hypothetical protein
MSLMTGLANKKADVYHKSFTERNTGGVNETWTLAIKDLACRIDHKSGLLDRLIIGEQAKDFDKLYCDWRTDITEGDKITNVRSLNKATGAWIIQNDIRRGVSRPAEYIVTHVHVPGSELDHLEIDIYKVAGQTMT